MRWRGPTTVGIAGLAALAFATSAQGATLSGDFDGDGRDDLAIGIQGEDVGGFEIGGAVQVVYGGRNGLSARDRTITRASRGVKGRPGDDGFGSALAAGRFDGDRFDDLAVGVPFDDVPGRQGPVSNGGSVQVLYGGPAGLTGRGDQILFHGRGGFGGPPRPFDGLGWTLATGDLAGSDHDDVAVTTINGRDGGPDWVGFVEILRGSASGLSGDRAPRFSQASRGIDDAPEDLDAFGWSLGAGDLARNGRDELVIGVPRESVGAVAFAGVAHVLFGGRRGVRARGSQYLNQEVLYQGDIEVDGTPEVSDGFGSAIVAAQRDERPKEDLVIGAPGESVAEECTEPAANSGMVTLVSGGRTGLRIRLGEVGALVFPGCTDGDAFGSSLTAANLGKGRLLEVAVGAPHREGDQENAGAVRVIYGGPAGGYDSILQGQDGVADFGENGDLFGHALAAGRFDGRGLADLAVGVPGEGILPPDGAGRTMHRGGPVPIPAAGAVAVFPGAPGGVSFDGDRLLFQGDGRLEGAIEAFDNFGVALGSPQSGPTFD